VMVHMEDTAPHGHLRLESLAAFSVRIQVLAFKQLWNLSLANLAEMKLATLATECVTEIVGAGVQIMDTLRIDTSLEFPQAPFFPWETHIFDEEGSLYMKGRYGINLCTISSSGSYSGAEPDVYQEFTKDMIGWANPFKRAFASGSVQFHTGCSAYKRSGKPFVPTAYKTAKYVVRCADCDMYVNIRTSVQPGSNLVVHMFYNDRACLFICVRDARECVLACFGHYGKKDTWPVSQEEIRCASMRVPALLKFCVDRVKPPANEDFDLSNI